MNNLFVAILAGGSGTRFWPESRNRRPKQLLPITGGKPMLVQTVERLRGLVPAQRIFVVTHERQAPAVRKMLRGIPAKNILAEPFAKNTAASVGWAAISLPKNVADPVMAVLPADHAIETRERFQADLLAAAQAAQQGGLITFGIRPSYPATGYGYLEKAARAGGKTFRVRRFTEKPPLQKAKSFVASGKYFWNSGMFLWKRSVILRAIQRDLPALHRSLVKIASARGGKSFPAVLRKEFAGLKSISVDYGILEKSAEVKMIEASFRWSDVGSWAALHDLMRRNGTSNVSLFPLGGELLQIDSRGCLVFSEKPHLIAAVGLEDLIIVRTPDATLVCRKDRAEEVKLLVEELKRRHQDKYL